MKFEITFASPNNWAFTGDTLKDIGLNGVDLIKKELKVDLPLERIKGQSYLRQCDIIVELSEEIARESGMFKATNTARIEVPKGYANKYEKMVVSYQKDETTGEILEARICRECDVEALINEWINKGYPERMGFGSSDPMIED